MNDKIIFYLKSNLLNQKYREKIFMNNNQIFTIRDENNFSKNAKTEVSQYSSRQIGNKKEEFINFALKENFNLTNADKEFNGIDNYVNGARLSIRGFNKDTKKYLEIDEYKIKFQQDSSKKNKEDSFKIFNLKFHIQKTKDFKILIQKKNNKSKKIGKKKLTLEKGETNKNFGNFYFSWLFNKIIISQNVIVLHENLKKLIFDLDDKTTFYYNKETNEIFQNENNEEIDEEYLENFAKISLEKMEIDNEESQEDINFTNDLDSTKKLLIKIENKNKKEKEILELKSNKISYTSKNFIIEIEKSVSFQVDSIFHTKKKQDFTKLVEKYSPLYKIDKNSAEIYKICKKNSLIMIEIKNNDEFNKAKNQIIDRLTIIRKIIKYTGRLYCLIILNAKDKNFLNDKRKEIIEQIEIDFKCKLLVLFVKNEFLGFDFSEFNKNNFVNDFRINKLDDNLNDFKTEIRTKMDNFETKMDNFETKMDNFETKMDLVGKCLKKIMKCLNIPSDSTYQELLGKKRKGK